MLKTLIIAASLVLTGVAGGATYDYLFAGCGCSAGGDCPCGAGCDCGHRR